MWLLVMGLLVLDIPAGPGAAVVARKTVAPYTVAGQVDDTGWRLAGVEVAPGSIDWWLVPQDAPDDAGVDAAGAAVTLSLDDPPSVTTSLAASDDPRGLEAAERVARRVRSALAEGRLTLRRLDAEAVQVRAKGERDRAPPVQLVWTTATTWPYALLLAVTVLALLASTPSLGQLLPPVTRGTWAGVFSVTVALGAVLAGLPDVVAHHHGHGWDSVERLAGPDVGYLPADLAGPSVYGTMHEVVTRALSPGASPGAEPFRASRVAGTLAIPLLFLLALVGLGRARPALLAAGLLAVQPAWIFIARSETPTAQGVLLFEVALLAAICAARTRERRWLVVVGLAGLTLTLHRLSGPVLAAPVALALLLTPGPDGWAQRVGAWSRWWVALVATGAVALALAWPHLSGVLTLGQGHGTALDILDIRWPHPLPHHIAWGGPWLWMPAMVGGAALVARRRTRGLGLALALLTALVVVTTVSAVGNWAGLPRYQAVLLVPLALGIAWTAEACIRAGKLAPPRLVRPVEIAVIVVLLAGLGYQLLQPAVSVAVTHPEERQLQVWRDGRALLPPDAVVVVPAHSVGGASSGLPVSELLAARPDVTVVEVSQRAAPGLVGRPQIRWAGLACHARRDEPDPDSDCEVPPRIGLWVTVVDTWLPDRMRRPPAQDHRLRSHVFQDHLDREWNLLPYPEPTVRIGFWDDGGV